MGGLGGVTLFQFFLTLFLGLIFWSSKPHDPSLVALVGVALSLQYWPDKVFHGLTRLGIWPKIGITKREYESHRWRSDGGWPFGVPIDRILLDWPWLVKSVNCKEFEYFYLRMFFPQLDFFIGSKIRHQL